MLLIKEDQRETETKKKLTTKSLTKREGATKVAFEEKEVTLVMIKYSLPSFAFTQTKYKPEQSEPHTESPPLDYLAMLSDSSSML